MSRQQDSAVDQRPARPARPTPAKQPNHRNPPAPLTDPPKQPMQALERANQIRMARAELRHRIATGQIPAAAVITDPPEEALGWAVAEVLTAQHGWGSSHPRRPGMRTRNLLSRLAVRETRTLGELTPNQRERIARALEGHDKQAGAR